MMPNVNPMQMIGNMMKSGGNPQGMIMNIIQNNMKNNPMAMNMCNLIKNGDKDGIEKMARNMCESNGITPEQAISEARKLFGM